MSKSLKIVIGLIIVVALLFLGQRYVSGVIKTKVADQLADEYGLEHKDITVGLWNGYVHVDSISGIGKKGTVSKAKILDLNWYQLYRKKTVSLDNLCFDLENITSWTKDQSHMLTIKKAVLKNGTFYIEDLSFQSPLGVEAFMSDSKFRRPRFDIKIPRIDASGISGSPIFIQHLRLQDAIIGIAEDLNLPVSGKKKKLPVQLINEIDFDFTVDSMNIVNSRLEYSVKDNGSNERGKIAFTDLNMQLSNVTNDSLSIRNDNAMVIEITSGIENDGRLKFISKHFLDSPTYQYDVFAQLNDFELSRANGVVNAAKNIDIESGRIKSLELTGRFHDRTCDGQLEIVHQDLKIDLNKKMAGLANIIGNAAIKKGGSEKVSFSSDRDVNKSFLLHVWQSVVDGMKKTILIF